MEQKQWPGSAAKAVRGRWALGRDGEMPRDARGLWVCLSGPLFARHFQLAHLRLLRGDRWSRWCNQSRSKNFVVSRKFCYSVHSLECSLQYNRLATHPAHTVCSGNELCCVHLSDVCLLLLGFACIVYFTDILSMSWLVLRWFTWLHVCCVELTKRVPQGHYYFMHLFMSLKTTDKLHWIICGKKNL